MNNKKPFKLIFITGNKHKFTEFKNFISRQNLNVILEHKDIETAEIQSDSLENVAKFKIESIKSKISGNFFIEDAGFFVESLNGFPGVYSSYVLKSIGNQGILKLLENNSKRNARFKAVIAMNIEGNGEIHIFKGEVLGKVAEKMRGAGGFGFDPIFIPNEIHEKTFGEMLPDEKNKISHRSRAGVELFEFIKRRYFIF